MRGFDFYTLHESELLRDVSSCLWKKIKPYSFYTESGVLDVAYKI